jgi:hypothetical protein
MIDGTLPGYWIAKTSSLTLTNTTKCKILMDVTPAQVVAAVSGETAQPGESAVRQRVLTGGARIIDGKVTSTDAAAKSLKTYIGEQLTLYANMGTATTTATTNATITRSTGSFITDGWIAGDQVMLDGAVSAANNGTVATITAVAATTLTLSGVTAVSVAETQGAGFRLIRLVQTGQIPVPANSGNSDSILPVKLFGHANDVYNDLGIQLGATNLLIGALVANASALPAAIQVSINAGLY